MYNKSPIAKKKNEKKNFAPLHCQALNYHTPLFPIPHTYHYPKKKKTYSILLTQATENMKHLYQDDKKQ